MISRNQIKYITSLKHKKFRDEENKFIVEGDKMVQELIYSDFITDYIFATKEWINSCNFSTISEKTKQIIEISRKELDRISFLKTPHNVLAIAEMKVPIFDLSDIAKNLSLALENIQNPGNLGTILRTADWFGIKDVFCSLGSTDIYNPKVVQASMGAIFRVNVHYVDLNHFIYHESKTGKLPIYGTFLDGDNIYKQNLSVNGIVIFGNEGSGISDDLSRHITKRLHIPAIKTNSESLNIASAVAIVCSEFRRRR